jgi:hypothetical protein
MRPWDRYDAKATTEAEGRFTIEGVTTGEWWIGPVPPKRTHGVEPDLAEAVAPVAELVRVEPGASLVEVVVRTHRGLVLRGVVVDPEGAPVATVMVNATSVEPGTAATSHAHTSGSGRFVLGPLLPGEYELRSGTRHDLAPIEPVRARAGDRDVVLRLRAGATIAGRVVGLAGDGSTVLRVSAVALNAPGYWQRQGGDAAFEFGGLLPGEYALYAHTTDGRCAVHPPLRIGQAERVEGIEMRLGPGAKLRLRREGTQGVARFRVLAGDLLLVRDGVQAGDVFEQVVPAGEVAIESEVERDLPWERRTVRIAAGESRDIVLPAAR